ncbi:MAG: hypothetical protein JKY65_32255 [Planctomycetes bacterium]|nr:hypothetical protein [Planctomycetota bacterium]
MRSDRNHGPTMRCRARWGWVSFALLLGLPLGARAQEFDRASENPESRREAAPITSWSSGLRVVPAELDLSEFPVAPDEHSIRKAPEPSDEWIRLAGKIQAAAGYDHNVFRGEQKLTGDGFGLTHGEAEALIKLPTGGELFLQVAGETLVYLERNRANEYYGSAFVEYYQPVTGWLEVGVQNAFEYSRLNLLDDNGDLFPRGRFGSLDEELRLFTILSAPIESGELAKLSLEIGSSYRLKDYQENSGLDSLDYRELRFDASLRYKVSAGSARSRLKLKYRFRRRDYREFRARERDGAVGVMSPHLDLERHQLSLRWTHRTAIEDVKVRFAAEAGLSYNRDDYANDRSYRQASMTLSAEVWPIANTTQIEVSLRGIARDFLSRQPSGGGGRLHHRLIRVRGRVWQRLWTSQGADSLANTGVTLAVFTAFSVTFWRSDDSGEDYDRMLFRGGLELSW